MMTQQDTKVRMVSLENLRAMCRHISGWSHTFEVTKVSRSRVTVTYSNPDEYGRARYASVIFPCYPSVWDDDKGPNNYNPRVVLDPIGSVNDADGFAYQIIEAQLISGCPTLWRGPKDPVTGQPGPWATHAQLIDSRGETAAQQGSITGDRCHVCTVCDTKGAANKVLVTFETEGGQ